MEDQNALTWSVFGLWNKMLDVDGDRPVTPRDRIWASELGKSYVDIWLGMKGVAPTNPPNLRSRRKFMAGNFWEWFFVRMMHTAGIFQSAQDYIRVNIPGLVTVSGKLDIRAGGTPDYGRARESINGFFAGDDSSFGLKLKKGMLSIVDHLELTFGTRPLKNIIIEVKSCSAFMFDHYERTGKANPNHVLQLYHYLEGSPEYDEGHVFYVSKDDCRVLEIGVWKGEDIRKSYIGFVSNVTNYYHSDTQPPVEPLVVFDPDVAKFSKNWKVEYSNYLTKLYGYESPEVYRDTWEPEIGKINRVFKRCVDRATMTKLNMDQIEKTKATLFPQWDELVLIGRKVKEAGMMQAETNGDEPL